MNKIPPFFDAETSSVDTGKSVKMKQMNTLKFYLKPIKECFLLASMGLSSISINFFHLIDQFAREQSNYDIGT